MCRGMIGTGCCRRYERQLHYWKMVVDIDIVLGQCSRVRSQVKV